LLQEKWGCSVSYPVQYTPWHWVFAHAHFARCDVLWRLGWIIVTSTALPRLVEKWCGMCPFMHGAGRAALRADAARTKVYMNEKCCVANLAIR